MLHRVIYASQSAGGVQPSTLAIAQILGVSAPNNRRDHLTSCVLFHGGHVLQIIEGARPDIDRLLSRLSRDDRHQDMHMLSERRIGQRAIADAMELCGDPVDLLRRLGRPCISLLSPRDAEALVDLRRAA